MADELLANATPRPWGPDLRHVLRFDAPDWKRLAELGFKPDKRLRDRITAGLQGLYHSPPVGWRSLLERYVEREAQIHVHLRIRRGDDPARRHRINPYLPDYTELCATFEWPDGALFKDLEIESHWGWIGVLRPWPRDRREAVQADERINDVGMAVLVDAPQFIQDGELVPVWGALPTTKWLQPLEICKQTWIDGPESLLPDLRPLLLVQDDGEADPPPAVVPWDRVRRRRTRFEIAQLPDELIERGAEVVDDIANKTPERRGDLAGWSRVERQFPWDHLHVSLDFEGVRAAVDKGDSSPFERSNVYVRALNPFETTLEISHGATSP